LNVGLDNGVLLRTVVDNVTGALSDSRSKFLGTNAIKLSKIKVNGQDAVVALSNKPWLCYVHMGTV
jgi:splicing factor 3B subunit 3